MSDLYPDKFTPVEQTVVGEAAVLIGYIQSRRSERIPTPFTIGELFAELRKEVPSSTYESFALALTFLYGAGSVDYADRFVRGD